MQRLNSYSFQNLRISFFFAKINHTAFVYTQTIRHYSHKSKQNFPIEGIELIIQKATHSQPIPDIKTYFKL